MNYSNFSIRNAEQGKIYLGIPDTEDLEPLCSNCHGTTIYALGAKREFIDSFQTNIIGKLELIISNLGWADRCWFLKTDEWPGNVGSSGMLWFLKNKCEKIEEPRLGCVIASTKEVIGHLYIVRYLWHTALYLCRIKEKDITFHQENSGCPYEFSEWKRFNEPHWKEEYYIYNP